MRLLPNRRAFTMPETLSVVAILALAVGLAGGSAWHVLHSLQLRNSASEFLQAVKNARQYAIDHHCRTRVVFREGVWDPAKKNTTVEEERSYRTFAFIVPRSTMGDTGRWVAVTADIEDEDAKKEWARMELAPRSESMVGRWLVCEGDQQMRLVPNTLLVTSSLFERFNQGGEHDEFFRDNFHTPESAWAVRGADPHEFRNSLSAYPSDYWRTPIDAGPVLFSGEIPSDERCEDPVSGAIVPAAQFWPGTVSFIRGAQASKTEELPGIEFRPDGSLACQWTEQVEFRFAAASRPQTEYVVAIDAATGRVRLLDAETK